MCSQCWLADVAQGSSIRSASNNTLRPADLQSLGISMQQSMLAGMYSAHPVLPVSHSQSTFSSVYSTQPTLPLISNTQSSACSTHPLLSVSHSADPSVSTTAAGTHWSGAGGGCSAAGNLPTSTYGWLSQTLTGYYPVTARHNITAEGASELSVSIAVNSVIWFVFCVGIKYSTLQLSSAFIIVYCFFLFCWQWLAHWFFLRL